MDEATPGNTLNPANSRKYCAVYFSWVEMGRWRLTCTHAWLPAAFIRTDEIRNVEGGTGAVMKALLRIMFVEEHALTRGVDLPLPSGSRRIYFTSHAFLADADAHKATFDYFGMPTPTFPKRHWNKLHSHATPPSIVFVARHARVIILACTRAFHARSQLGQKSCLPSWGLWLCLVAGGLLGCSGVGVLPHDFSGGGTESTMPTPLLEGINGSDSKAPQTRHLFCVFCDRALLPFHANQVIMIRSSSGKLLVNRLRGVGSRPSRGFGNTQLLDMQECHRFQACGHLRCRRSVRSHRDAWRD